MRNDGAFRIFSVTTEIGVLFFVIGVLLIILSSTLGDHFEWVHILRDIGLLFGPVGLAALLIDIHGKNEIISAIAKVIEVGHNNISIVPGDRRVVIMRKIIEDAVDDIVIVGNSPLEAFRNDMGWLVSNFKRLQNVVICSQAEDSSYIQTREAQMLDERVDLRDELQRNRSVISELNRELGGEKIHAVFYDLPPAEWFVMADNKTVLGTWYPFCKGEKAPCLYLRDSRVSDNSSKLIQHYQNTISRLTSHFAT